MTSDRSTITEQAIAWHLRADTMAAEDWPTFVAWLEADAEHARAYDAIVAQDALIPHATFPGAAANDDAPAPARWWRIAGGTAIAAGLAAWLMPFTLPSQSPEQVFRTRDGERRDVRLADGTQIAMNGGTILRIDPVRGRSAELVRGEVTLHVVHDADRPFDLRVGDRMIRDLGTTFDVVRSGATVSVAVSEGSVMVDPDAAAIRLAPGQALRMTGDRFVRRTVATESVGGWRNGILTFDGAPVADVVAGLRRLHGIDVRVAGALSQRPFTGMIHVTGTADRDIPHLADLIGATWRRDGEGWVLVERANTVR